MATNKKILNLFNKIHSANNEPPGLVLGIWSWSRDGYLKNSLEKLWIEINQGNKGEDLKIDLYTYKNVIYENSIQENEGGLFNK